MVLLVSCNQKEDELRLRILASSNTSSDQLIKHEVKEYLKEYLQGKDVYKLDLQLLEEDLNKTFEQSIIVNKNKVLYEAKTYKGKIVPSGYYETILITIGKGEGKNFWTILYPEFFDISFDEDNEIVYKSYFYELLHNKINS